MPRGRASPGGSREPGDSAQAELQPRTPSRPSSQRPSAGGASRPTRPSCRGGAGEGGVTVAHLGLGNRSGLPRLPSPVSASPSSVLTLPNRDESLVRHQAPGIEPDVQSQGPAPRGLQPRPPCSSCSHRSVGTTQQPGVRHFFAD